MCNLYNLKVERWELQAYYKANDDFRREVELEKDYVAPSRPGLVVRIEAGQRIVDDMTWGVPNWKPGLKDVVNVRNYQSNFWRSMLAKPAQRCLVPFTRFQEWEQLSDPVTGKKCPHWFSIPSRPIGTFAGIWRYTEKGPRFAFLTTGYGDTPNDDEDSRAAAPNHVVGRIHPKAVPVILHDEHFDTWLNAPVEEALKLAVAFPSQLIAMDVEE